MMRRALLLAAIPLGLSLPLVFGGFFGEKAPILTSNHKAIEQTVGYHLLAPSHLPRGMRPGENGMRIGALRVLCEYGRGDATLVIAQERRRPERDAYNRSRFVGERVDVNGHEGVFTKGNLGERRLTFFTPDVTIILSSSSLTDKELVAVAESMR